jgi:hypothetical protein
MYTRVNTRAKCSFCKFLRFLHLSSRIFESAFIYLSHLYALLATVYSAEQHGIQIPTNKFQSNVQIRRISSLI